jgi:hypothetical protein
VLYLSAMLPFKPAALSAVILMLASDSCNRKPSGGVMCTMLYAYGITVMVVDSASGDSIRSGAMLIARDGAYADTVRQGSGAPIGSTLSTAGERPGTYSLTVLKSGYQQWTRSGMKVTKDECHVRGVAITARLQR